MSPDGIPRGHCRDVDLMFEIGSLRHVRRTWHQFGGVPVANVAEHTLRVAFLAWSFATIEGADVSKAVRIAMIHDLPEARTGDVNYLSCMYTGRDEDRALQDQLATTSIGPQAEALWREWRALGTLEAQVVADADALDCDHELRESASVGLSLDAALAHTRTGVPDRLHTQAGRSHFERLQETDPHAWHTAGPNRHTSGDWTP